MIDKVDNLKRMTGGYNLSIQKADTPDQISGESLIGTVASIFDIQKDQLKIVHESSQKITLDITSLTTVGDKFQRL